MSLAFPSLATTDFTIKTISKYKACPFMGQAQKNLLREKSGISGKLLSLIVFLILLIFQEGFLCILESYSLYLISLYNA